MKKTETIKVPPTTRQITRIFCDIDGCKDKAKLLYGGGSYASCEICERDLCKRHLVYDTDEVGDYPMKWCTICYSLYYHKRKEMQERHWREEEELIKSVKKESLNASA